MSLFENSCVFKGLKYYNHRGIQPNSTLLKIKHSFNSEPNTHHNNPGGSSFPLFTEAELPRIEQDQIIIVKSQSECLTRETGDVPKSNKSNIQTPKVHYFYPKGSHCNTLLTAMFIFSRASDKITCLKFVKLNIGFGRVILIFKECFIIVLCVRNLALLIITVTHKI